MIRDITIGQYFPGTSLIHNLDPRMKIVLLVLNIAALFLCRNFFSLLLMFVMSVAWVLLSRIPFSTILKGLKMILVILIFTAFLQIFYNDGGTVLWHPVEKWDFKITTEGVFSAIFIAVRIIALILMSTLLTYTTSPTLLTDAIERLLSPLKVFKIKVHSLAMMMTIALRFIPTLIEEIDIIMSAQKARGADLETGSLVQRAKALVPILVPLFVNSFRRAYELAFAMEARCYGGDEKRTRLRVMKLGGRDFAMLAITLVCFVAVIVTSYVNMGSFFLFEKVI
ncbi:MAG: energy-coupling factor transporter transmembrane protein EcfT [Ruminococcaceae bacterium]|nr:energy-coupling factor transporter transmembrane protein EcfT [Oscillospiraceae bacterium]